MAYAVEIFISVLMIATCGYCYVLNRKLQALREGQTELLKTIEQFDSAARRAEQNLNAMQGTGAAMNRDLASATERAHALIDELSVMVNAGDHIAGRIEGVMREVKAVGGKRKRLAS